MSDRDPTDLTIFRQLEQVVRHLSEDLAMYRRRALQAEARAKALEAATTPGNLFTEQRVRELEDELRETKARLRAASERARLVLEQVRFLRQQESDGVVRGGAGTER